MPKPNFFIVGAPKCGTTALSEYLRDHPNIFISIPKEPHFFANDLPGRQFVCSLDKYIRLFDNANNNHIAIGEASVWYLYSDVALLNIKHFNSKAKIIVMLRNPVNLVYSFHSQSLYNKSEDQRNFKAAWDLVCERKQGKHIPKYCSDIKLLYYNEIAKLGSQLERLYNIFPAEQVKTIFYEDFSKNTQKVYEEVLQFLDVPSDSRTYFPKVNQNKQHKSQLVALFTKHPPKSLVNLALKVKKYIGIDRIGLMSTLESINKKETVRVDLDPDFSKEIYEVYKFDIQKLAKITGQDLSNWHIF